MMALKCCVGGCNATSETHRVFCIPKNDSLRNLWMSFLVPRNPILINLSKEQLLKKRVCEKHFDKLQFDGEGKRLRYSYPCLFTDDEIAHGEPLSSVGAVRNVLRDHNYFKEQHDEKDLTVTCLVVGRAGENFHEHPSCSHSRTATLVAEKRGVAIHRFPSVNKHPDSFKAWVTAVKGTTEVTDTDYEYYKDMVVCDVHFTDHYRNRNNRINRLAVPSRVPYGIEVQTSLDLQPEHAAIKPKTESVRRQSCDQGIPCLTFDAKSNINTEQNIVTVAKTFSWQKCSEAFPIQTDDSDYSDDNVSMYCDDNEPHKTSQATGDKGNTTVHQGFRCNVCDGAITEVRYTCVQCSGFDLCCACENNRAHQQHYVLRVPALRPVAEIQFVLDTIRRHLIKRLDPIIEPEWNHGDAISIKSEVKSESEDDYDDDNDEQKVISGYESDSSDLWAARKQSDNEETHCGMDEIMKTKVSVAHAMEGVVSIEDILAETNTTDERAIAIDAREAQEMDSESPAEERVRAVRTDEMPTESDNTTNEKEIHMRGDTRETESPTVKQNTPCTDAGHHSHKPPNNKKIVIRRANIINLQEAKKICIRPFLNSQSLVNVLSLYSQSTGVVKLRKQIMVLKPVREVLTLRHQNVFASTNNNTIVGNS